MIPCPHCGAFPQASDRFCDVCGSLATCVRAGVSTTGFGGPPGGYGQPPYGGGGGGGAPLRCQMGHEIAPGASYCPHGHPIALDAMPFANDQYGGGYGQQQGGFGAPPPQQGGFGAPPPQQGGFGAPPPQQGYGAPGGYDPNAQYGQQQGGFGAPPQQGGFGAPPQQGGFGAPPPQQGGFGQAPGGYDPGGFGGQPAQPAYGQPAGGGFGAQAPAPAQPGFGAPAAPAPQPEAPLPPHALRGFLVSYQSNSTGDFWPLHGGRKTVGRSNSGENVDIPLSDATISSRHAAVNVDGVTGVISVEDTGSTNGTYVNEEHVGFNGRRDLKDGDRIRFGGYQTIVKIIQR